MKLVRCRVTLRGGPRNGQVFEMDPPAKDAVLLRIVGDPNKPKGVARYEFDPFEAFQRDITAHFVCFMDPLRPDVPPPEAPGNEG